jgi:hypothetical protein
VSGALTREIAQPGGESRELLKKLAHPGGESSAGAAGAGHGVLLRSGPFCCRQQIPAPLLHTHIPPRLLDIAASNVGVIAEYLLLILLPARGMINVITSSCVITIDFTLNITKIKKQKCLIYV